MKWHILVVLGCVVFVYLSLGGVGFHYLEGREETGHKTFIRNFTKFFLEGHQCITEEELEFMVLTYMEAYDRGIIEIANKSSLPNWDLASSVFFSVTVITTIGYGNIYPVTSYGRALCVIYALIGIPLCLVFLTGIGQRLNVLFRAMDRYMKSDQERYPRCLQILRLGVILGIGAACFIFLPALMFVYIDGWSYSAALYYCIITLTTVGFGDLVPGLDDSADRNRSLYRVMVGVWVFIGLAWLAGIITFLQDWYSKVADRAGKTIDKTKKELSAKMNKSGDVRKCSVSSTSSEVQKKQPPRDSDTDDPAPVPAPHIAHSTNF